MAMKKRIHYYKKCFCCEKIQGYVLRDIGGNSETNPGINDDASVYHIMAQEIKPENRIRIDWCENCQMHTKQEEIAWDYLEGKECNIPADKLCPESEDD